MIRTEQIKISDNKELSTLCHLSKNLWNEGDYLCRQAYFHNKYNPEEPKEKIPSYAELDKLLKQSENYKLLPAQSAQQTLRVLDKSWKSFWESIKEYNKTPSKFKGQPKPPQFKPKDGEAILIFTNQQAHIRNHLLTFTKKLPLKIKTRLSGKINQVRFIPKGTGYICEIVYEKQSEKEIISKRWYSKPNKNIIGIDYGVANIVTIANNIGLTPIVIKDDGIGIKSINQFYNKQKALLQSIYDKQNIKFGSKMQILNSKRNAKIKDGMHKISKFIVDYCVKNDIETISIGHNDGWKQQVNLGTKTNQKFVTIPFNTLTQMIEYKAQEQGISVKTPKEDHTSKCSFLDLESIEHHDSYLGKRFSRGLFKSNLGLIIHSDVNGAYNIIRRSEPKAFANGVGGCGLHPISLNPLRSNN